MPSSTVTNDFIMLKTVTILLKSWFSKSIFHFVMNVECRLGCRGLKVRREIERERREERGWVVMWITGKSPLSKHQNM